MTDDELAEAAEATDAVRPGLPGAQAAHHPGAAARRHTVGFMGDGINDAPALHAADVGICVDTAVDIAKESADVILLEKILLVLDEGVLEGRKVFANILKYIRMGASSNFGNMFSVLGASVFLPFLPMAPIQILTNNLLYDISQIAIPTDDVDPEQIAKPRPWDIERAHALHPVHRPVHVDLRLHDVLRHALRLRLLGLSTPRPPRTAEPVPDRLVRREPAHADADHPRHPHEQDPVPAEPAVCAADGDDAGDHGDRRRAAVLAAGPLARLHRAAAALLAALALTLLCYVLLTQAVKTWLLRRGWIR